MARVLIETSGFVSLLKKINKRICYIEQRLEETYKNSLTHRAVKRIWDKIKNYFKYSFLGRIAGIKEKDNVVILYNSKFAIWLLRVYKNSKNWIVGYLRTSIFVNSAGELKESLFFLPVKIVSTILITAILINIFLFLLFDKEIELLGWILRGSLFFIGLGGLFCNANLHDIKITSLVLRYIGRRM